VREGEGERETHKLKIGKYKLNNELHVQSSKFNKICKGL
jgi:hypothetical protein